MTDTDKKLTDKQKEEVLLADWELSDLNSGIQFGDPFTLKYYEKLIKAYSLLKASEKAWKEEAEAAQERLKGVGVEEYYTLKYQHGQLVNNFNRAIQVLRDTDHAMEKSIELLREDSFENWDEVVNILMATRKGAVHILSSLKEDKS